MTEYKGSSEYENLGLLGEGGQGTVFRVRRKKDGEVSFLSFRLFVRLADWSRSSSL
jgi:hypothetical protein